MKVTIVSETALAKGQGVHTAFVKTVEKLSQQGVELSINTFRKADVIHAHTFFLLYWIFTAFQKKKTVITAHVIPESLQGSIIGSSWWLPLFSWYLRCVYNHARYVIAVAPHVKEQLEQLGVKTTIVYIPNGVDREQFFPSHSLREQYRQKLGYGTSDTVVISVGQVQSRKGVQAFIDTARQLPEYKFLWIGGRPFGRITAGYAELEADIQHSPANLHFTGTIPLEEMNGFYNVGDMFFFPSFQENFPFAILEAAACGLPLLLRDNNEYPPLFGDSYLAGNDENFIQKINDLVHHTVLRQQYIQKAQALAEKYSLENHIRQLLEVYSWCQEKTKKY